MRRIVIERPGGYAALQLIESATPEPRAGEVRIKVEAAGVNYADSIIRMGLYESAKQLAGYPLTPGFELAGTIEALGADVEGWRVGEPVIGVTLFGAYTSHICLPLDRVFRRPAALDARQAAAIPTVFLTAWFMVRRQVYPQAGDVWLVHSAAGGVGGALAQLGHNAGVRVIGVVGGEHKRAAALAAGCTVAISTASEALWPRAAALAPGGYSAIFDANGVKTLADSYAHLAPMGKLCVYGFASMLPRNGRLNWFKLAWDWLRTPRFSPLKMTRDNRSVMAANLSFLSAQAPLLAEGMRELLDQFERGLLKPPPITAYPLDRVADAHRAIESGQTVGKLVLEP